MSRSSGYDTPTTGASLAQDTPIKRACLIVPAQLGTVASSVVLLLISISFTLVGWIAGNKLNYALTDLQRLAIIFHVFVYILLGVCALYATSASGGIQPRSRLTSLISAFFAVQLVFSIVSGSLCLYLLFNPTRHSIGTPSDYNRCFSLMVGSPKDKFLRQLCTRAPVLKGLSVTLYIFGWMTEIFSIHAARQFTVQLREEEVMDQLLNPKLCDDRDAWHV